MQGNINETGSDAERHGNAPQEQQQQADSGGTVNRCGTKLLSRQTLVMAPPGAEFQGGAGQQALLPEEAGQKAPGLPGGLSCIGHSSTPARQHPQYAAAAIRNSGGSVGFGECGAPPRFAACIWAGVSQERIPRECSESDSGLSTLTRPADSNIGLSFCSFPFPFPVLRCFFSFFIPPSLPNTTS